MDLLKMYSEGIPQKQITVLLDTSLKDPLHSPNAAVLLSNIYTVPSEMRMGQLLGPHLLQ